MKIIYIILIIYLLLDLIWSSYCVYRTSKMGKLGELFYNKFMTFIINFILFPYAVYITIKNKKL